MSVVVITPPAPDIDLELVKTQLRVEGEDDDVLIQAFIDAACSHIDGPSGWLGKSIWPQTLELRQNALCGPIRLPYGPISEVASVKYIDSDGVEQTVDDATYTLTGDGNLVLAYNQSWPSHRGDAEGVRIQYEAGFEETPSAVIAAVLIMVADLYKNRESNGPDGSAIQMSTTVENLLAPFRVWRV